MTERWRKRLRDLDDVTPSEDVYHRAHDGPQMPEEMIPRPSTGTRIVTGVAAFLVFGLAISVFAIPALRMKDSAGSAAQVGLLPLWPARTLDDLEALQARADDGDADSVLLLDPARAASQFGTFVMGWKYVDVQEVVGAEVVAEVVTDYTATAYPVGTFTEVCPPEGEDGYCAVGVGPTDRYPSGVPTGGYEQSTSPPSPYRTFAIRECDCASPVTMVTFYQPLDAGEGQIWAVIEVSSPAASFNVGAGQAIADGFAIKGEADVVNGTATLGYRSGIGACDVRGTASGNAPAWSETNRVEVDLEPADEMGCAEAEAGYVWLGVSDPVAGEVAPPVDPFDSDANVLLAALSAVSVTFLQDDPLSSPHVTTSTDTATAVTPTPSVSPTPTPSVDRVAHADPLGWTVEFPNTWSVERIDTFDRVMTQGAAFQGDGLTVRITNTQGGPLNIPSDDSSYPLDADEVLVRGDGDWSGGFSGDGLVFTISVTEASGAAISSDQAEMVSRLIESIRFDPWEQNEQRNGYTDAGEITPNATAQWVTFNGGHWYATNADGRRVLIGPAPTCQSGGSFEMSEGAIALVRCPDGTGGEWDREGRPLAGNTPGFDSALDGYLAVLSWEGHLLVDLDWQS